MKTSRFAEMTGWASGMAFAGALGCSSSLDTTDGVVPGVDEPDGVVEPGDTCGPTRELRRMSNRRFGKAVQDLLGLSEAPQVTGGGGRSDTLIPGDSLLLSTDLAFEYQQVIRQAVRSVDAAELLVCGAAEAEADCVNRFVVDFGTRAFRRAPTAEETTSLVRLFEMGKTLSQQRGVELMVEAMLQSPSFLYQRALGVTTSTGLYELSAFEVAEQLAFMFLDSVPDAELINAAASQSLGTAEGIAAEVERLVATPRGQQHMGWVFDTWLGGQRVVGRTKDQELFPEFSAELQQSLGRSKQLAVDSALQQGGTLSELFSSSDLWVDSTLAGFLGVTAPDAEGFGLVTFPSEERLGILTHPALQAQFGTTQETSVVHRGLFVYSDVLCNPVAAPPPGALEEGLAVAEQLDTERQRAEYRAEQPICGACHKQFDAYGLAFEKYDAIGRYDSAQDSTTEVIAPASLAGSYAAPSDLMARVAAAPELAQCAVQRLLEVTLARNTTAGDQCITERVVEQWSVSGNRLSDLFRVVGTNPGLYVRTEAAQ